MVIWIILITKIFSDIDKSTWFLCIKNPIRIEDVFVKGKYDHIWEFVERIEIKLNF